MKEVLILGLAFAAIVNFGSHTGAKERNDSATVEQKASSLELTLVSPKSSYKRSDQFKLQAMLRNSSEDDLYVFGTLEWGYSASLMFHIRDASGKEVEPIFIPDPPPHAPPDDKSDFVKLRPDTFIGTTYFAPLKLMNFKRPGKYSIFVEYWCPFPSRDVTVSPFWGSEKGKLRSNVVSINVIQ
jgi:hypothetical protein